MSWPPASDRSFRKENRVDYKTILNEVDEGIGKVILNRPGQRNAQNEALILELDDA